MTWAPGVAFSGQKLELGLLFEDPKASGVTFLISIVATHSKKITSKKPVPESR
jgi:hypothetical protein